MPHLRILFKAEKVSGEVLNQSLQELTVIIGKHFDENPDYVSADIIPQSSWARNRKDIDLELDSSPDSAGVRSGAACALAEEMGTFLKTILERKGIVCEISSWVRIFQDGQYAYLG